MEAWISWAIFLAIGGGMYLYYSQNSNTRHRGRTTQRASHTTTTKGGPVQWSDSESTPKPSAKSAKAKAPRKSIKKTVQDVAEKAEAYLSNASSTGGADADDDLSPAVSPPLGATSATKGPSGRDVSDMLESQGAAPAVLKIGASEKQERQKPQQKRPETPQETKKQRQNRKKVEEAKVQREADEKQRQILLEKQRRTAREARGEPARNGLQPAQAPNNNAWTTVRSSGASNAPTNASAHSGQLLDTFDPDVASTTSSSEAATNGTAPTPDSLSNSGNWTNLPTEEEQMRLAMADSAWTEVPKGKKQRKTKAAGGDITEDGSESGAPQEPTSVPVKKAQPKKTENVQPQSRYGILSEPTNDVSHPMDSDWPVM